MVHDGRSQQCSWLPTSIPVWPDPSSLTVMNGMLYFLATTSANGTELWWTDGTAAGTQLVKDVYPWTKQWGGRRVDQHQRNALLRRGK